MQNHPQNTIDIHSDKSLHTCKSKNVITVFVSCKSQSVWSNLIGQQNFVKHLYMIILSGNDFTEN